MFICGDDWLPRGCPFKQLLKLLAFKASTSENFFATFLFSSCTSNVTGVSSSATAEANDDWHRKFFRSGDDICFMSKLSAAFIISFVSWLSKFCQCRLLACKAILCYYLRVCSDINYCGSKSAVPYRVLNFDSSSSVTKSSFLRLLSGYPISCTLLLKFEKMP